MRLLGMPKVPAGSDFAILGHPRGQFRPDRQKTAFGFSSPPVSRFLCNRLRDNHHNTLELKASHGLALFIHWHGQK